MILVVVANSDIAETLKRDEYMVNKDYYFLPVGGAIVGKDFSRIVIDTIELDRRTMEWLNSAVMVRLRKPVLPSMPDFLKNENLNDYLLKSRLDKARKDNE